MVEETLEKLEAAIANLRFKQVDKTALNNVIVEANTKLQEEEKYTDTSVQTLKDVLQEAESISANADARQDKVDAVVLELQTAINGLEEKPVVPPADKTALNNVIAEAKTKLQEEEKYTDASVQTLKDVLAEAESISANADARQDEVDAVVTKLDSAITGLKEKPVAPSVDKTELGKVIKRAEDVLKTNDRYTYSSIKDLEDELRKAKAVFDNDNATETEIQNAIENLNRAIRNIQIKEEERPVDRNNNSLINIIFDYGHREETSRETVTVQKKFIDIIGHWAEEVINYVVDKGYFKGIDETHFAPDKTITRGEFITVLGRIANINPNDYAKSMANDLNHSEFYYGYVNWAIAEGIANGYEDGNFKANDTLNREEMAVFLLNTLNYMDKKVNEASVSEFADDEEISVWSKDAVYRLVSSGYLKGVGENAFSPQTKLTRAETAQIIYNVE